MKAVTAAEKWTCQYQEHSPHEKHIIPVSKTAPYQRHTVSWEGEKQQSEQLQLMQSNFIWHFGYKYLPKNYGYSFINISANSVLITRTWIENFASPLSPRLPTMLSHPNSPFQNPSQLSIPEDHVIKAKIVL